MATPITRIYKNTSQVPLTILEMGNITIEPGEHTSVSSEYPPRVILENYPGLIEYSDVDLASNPDHPAADKPEEVVPSPQTQTEPTEGQQNV